MKLIEQTEQHRAEAWIESPRPLWVEPRRGLLSVFSLSAFQHLINSFSAFQNFSLSLGPTVVPLTWLRYHHLIGEGNPILGGPLDPESVIRALWILSPDWSASRRDWARFRRRHIRHYQARIGLALRAHVQEAFLEAPKTTPTGAAGGTPDYPASSFLGQLVHYFAKVYGWPRAEVLHMPVAVSYQLYNAATGGRSTPDGPAFNRIADQANGERIRRKTAELQAHLAAQKQNAQKGRN